MVAFNLTENFQIENENDQNLVKGIDRLRSATECVGAGVLIMKTAPLTAAAVA